MKNWRNVISALGKATCLIDTFLIAFGEPIVGVNPTGFATVVGIIGIGMTTTDNKTLFSGKMEEK